MAPPHTESASPCLARLTRPMPAHLPARLPARSSTARDAAAAQQQLQEYMEGLVAAKEAKPTDDVLSKVRHLPALSCACARVCVVSDRVAPLLASLGKEPRPADRRLPSCPRLRDAPRFPRCPPLVPLPPPPSPSVIQVIRSHLVAGNATVASMINLGLLSLLEHPDQVGRQLVGVGGGEGVRFGGSTMCYSPPL